MFSTFKHGFIFIFSLSVAELKVTNIMFANVSTNSFIVSWTPPTGKESFINSYTVDWYGTGDAGDVHYISPSASPTLIPGLTAGRAYTVRVYSINTQTDFSTRTTSVLKEQSASK